MYVLGYEAGRPTLALGRGAYLVAGVIAADQRLTPRQVEHAESTADMLDWLYEDPGS